MKIWRELLGKFLWCWWLSRLTNPGGPDLYLPGPKISVWINVDPLDDCALKAIDDLRARGDRVIVGGTVQAILKQLEE